MTTYGDKARAIRTALKGVCANSISVKQHIDGLGGTPVKQVRVYCYPADASKISATLKTLGIGHITANSFNGFIINI